MQLENMWPSTTSNIRTAFALSKSHILSGFFISVNYSSPYQSDDMEVRCTAHRRQYCRSPQEGYCRNIQSLSISPAGTFFLRNPAKTAILLPVNSSPPAITTRLRADANTAPMANFTYGVPEANAPVTLIIITPSPINAPAIIERRMYPVGFFLRKSTFFTAAAVIKSYDSLYMLLLSEQSSDLRLVFLDPVLRKRIDLHQSSCNRSCHHEEIHKRSEAAFINSRN